MKIIIDSRMRKQEKDYLRNFGQLIEIKPQNTVYEEISAHPDIFFCKLNNMLFRSPNLEMNIGTKGKLGVGKKYPEDAKYNVCQIGKFVVHNFKITDEKILEYINKESTLEKIQINQGYSNCSISVISDKACITSDTAIYETLKIQNIDCLLLKENNIHLLNKNGFKTEMNGFIGGSSCVIENKFILFGDGNHLENKNELLVFLKKHNLQFIDFPDLEIHDYGGVIICDFI